MNSSHKRHGLNPEWVSDEQGQSLTELMIGTILLMALVIATFEMAQVFRAYIALVNAASQASVYASNHPDVSEVTYGDVKECPFVDTSDPNADPVLVDCNKYKDRAENEFIAMGIDPELNVSYPVPDVTPSLGANCPITITITYQLYSFTSQMRLPIIGRMGLPDHYTLNYSVAMPIRNPQIDPNTKDEYPACQ